MIETTLTQSELPTEPTLAELPERRMLVVDGEGSSEKPAFAAAIGDLFAARARFGAGDVPVEGTYRQRDGEFDLEQPDGWLWSLAVPAPEGAGEASVDAPVRLVMQPGTRVVATVHRGPYESEGPTLAALRAAAAEHGLAVAGPHTERYLTSPADTAPEDLRTLLWYPVEA